MCMSMWAVSVVYNLFHIAHALLWNLTASACLTENNALSCKYSLFYVLRSSCLHQCYHHTPEWAARGTSDLFQFFPAAFTLLYRQLFSPFNLFKMRLKNVNSNHFCSFSTNEQLKPLMINNNSFIPDTQAWKLRESDYRSVGGDNNILNFLHPHHKHYMLSQTSLYQQWPWWCNVLGSRKGRYDFCKFVESLKILTRLKWLGKLKLKYLQRLFIASC